MYGDFSGNDFATQNCHKTAKWVSDGSVCYDIHQEKWLRISYVKCGFISCYTFPWQIHISMFMLAIQSDIPEL